MKRFSKMFSVIVVVPSAWGRERHELRPACRWGSPGVLFGRDVRRLERPAPGADPDVIFADIEANAALLELGNQRAQVGTGRSNPRFRSPPVMAPANRNVPASIRSGLIRWRAPWSFCDTLHLDGRGAGSLNLRPHCGKQRGKVGDLRLAGRSFSRIVFTLGKHGRHQNIFRAGHGNFCRTQCAHP